LLLAEPVTTSLDTLVRSRAYDWSEVLD